MPRPPLPSDIQQKIRDLHYSGMSQRAIARELGFNRIRIERVLNPEVVRKRERKKIRASVIRMDREETPAGCFNVNDYSNWMIG